MKMGTAVAVCACQHSLFRSCRPYISLFPNYGANNSHQTVQADGDAITRTPMRCRKNLNEGLACTKVYWIGLTSGVYAYSVP